MKMALKCDMCPPDKGTIAYCYVRWGGHPSMQDGNLCRECLVELFERAMPQIKAGNCWWEQTQPRDRNDAETN